MSNKKPGCPKPFGSTGYLKFVPECMKDEVAPGCGPCIGELPEPAAIDPIEAGLDWGSNRLAIDRRPELRSPLGRLGSSGYIKVIPQGQSHD